MRFGAILAGGTGSRMKLATMPKQFLPLGDKPVILHTITQFLAVPEIDYVYIGVHPDWVDYMQDLLKTHAITQRVRVLAGGADRHATILHIAQAICQNHGNDPDHIILTHDAVRPFVTPEIVKQNIELTQTYGACDTVMGATDTIIASTDGEYITGTPVRSEIFQAQTPQSMTLKILQDSYAKLTPAELAKTTDACSVVARAGYPVKLLLGIPENIKLTTNMDYHIAQYLVTQVARPDAYKL